MTTENTILNEFKTRFVEFLDELIIQFQEESDFIVARIFISDEIPIKVIVDEIIRVIMPHKDKIKSRDADFFFTNEEILSEYGHIKKIKFYRRIWKTLDKEDQDVMWQWFDLFVHIIKKYTELKLSSVSKSTREKDVV